MLEIYAKMMMEYSIVIKIPFYSEVFALVMIEDRCITLNKAQIEEDRGSPKKEDLRSKCQHTYQYCD